MERQNFTMSLPKDLLRKAKIQAAKENKSLSKFTREAMEEKLKQSSGYRSSMKKHLKLLSADMDLGTKGHLKIDREQAHERG